MSDPARRHSSGDKMNRRLPGGIEVIGLLRLAPSQLPASRTGCIGGTSRKTDPYRIRAAVRAEWSEV
jgi:hypothetical protein